MPYIAVNGLQLFAQRTGDTGPALVLVHGSWGDHSSWDAVVPDLSRHFQVLTYDRRGHGQSECPSGQGSINEDAADLAALISHVGLAPAHIIGNSFGASIVLRLASQRPDLFRSLVVHEPPLLDLPLRDTEASQVAREVRDRIAAVAERLGVGDAEGGTRDFFDTVAFSPGTWAGLTPQKQSYLVSQSMTFLDEACDPQAYSLDLESLALFPRPALLTYGDQSLPFYAPIVLEVGAALPKAETSAWTGVGHIPHASHPDEFVARIAAFVEKIETGST